MFKEQIVCMMQQLNFVINSQRNIGYGKIIKLLNKYASYTFSNNHGSNHRRVAFLSNNLQRFNDV